MKFHPNCGFKNWLIYIQSYNCLNSYKKFYKGVVYDLGCGEMPHKEYFLKSAEKYIGVDWSDTLHELKADVVADLNKTLPIDSNVADTVVTFSVLEHLYEPQVMLSEAYRILKPGAHIILQVPWQWWIHEAPHDYYRYTPYCLKYLFSKAGFKDIVVTPSAGFFTLWFLKFNYFSTRFIIGPRPIKAFVKAFLILIWSVLQLLAPFLDKLDRNWMLETPGYWVIATK